MILVLHYTGFHAYQLTVTPLEIAKTVTVSGVSLYPLIVTIKLLTFEGEKLSLLYGM